jgi:hypothetical protein
MSKFSFGAGAPTMIIPSGTQVHVDPHGQLSIRTPGNLVIQNSGAYGVLESVSGSIRIEPQVEVEAVTVRCAETCFVQGSLTAWRLVAKSLHLDGDAKAYVLMQETEHLEVGRHARLVGNFRSEKELFVLFSRYSRQMRALPFGSPGSVEAAALAATAPDPRASHAAEEVGEESGAEIATGPAKVLATDPEPAAVEELPEDLFFALVLLEREAERTTYGPTARRILRELANLLREGDLETLRHTHRTLFGRIREQGEDLRRAARLVYGFFSRD